MKATKNWTEMTEQEKADARELNRLIHVNQDAVRAKEAAVDALAAYLKSSKRKRPAPSMLFQYPGFDLRKVKEMVAEIERLEDVEDETGAAVATFGRARRERAS